MKVNITNWINTWIREVFRITDIEIENLYDEEVMKLQLRNALWKILEPKGRKDYAVKYLSLSAFASKKGERHHIIKHKETIENIIKNRKDKEEVLKILSSYGVLIKITKEEHLIAKNLSFEDFFKKFNIVDIKGKPITINFKDFTNFDIYKEGLKILESYNSKGANCNRKI